jgi:hypothetical protein
VAALLLFPAFISAKAFAAEKRQDMIYDVYAGGFHVLQANVTIDYPETGRYSIFMGAKTYGMLGKLAPWHGTFESKGWTLESGLQPEIHQSITTWRAEEEINTYKYNRDGSFKNYSVKESGKDIEVVEVEPELTEGTIDAFTAGLKVFENVAAGDSCNGVSEVFDGKRRFEQVFKSIRQETLSSSKYNIYTGPAHECTLEIVPVAGKWHDKPRGWMSIQEQGRERGTMPTIWLASMADGLPAVPVKIRVKTAYGTLFMHLAEYKSAQDVRVADQRVQ